MRIFLPNSVLQNILLRVVKELMENTNHVFITPRFWGSFGVTRRKNGSIVVGGFRDIIDTEELLNSLSAEIISPTRANLLVKAKHGAHVYFGTRKISGRPWFRNVVIVTNNKRRG